ncbi:MAG: phosphate acyltransferase PlsX, partial [Pygmaiobacter sp.]
STGALLTGATLITKRIKGVKRAAIATVIPGQQQAYLLLDSGANVECPAEMLNCFATMGSVYAEKVLGRLAPKVALVNNGAEESKGTAVYVAAHKLMRQNKTLNFVGNVEPREIPTGAVDVVVCDGFTGNVILKLTEGLARFFTGELKTMFFKNTGTKLAALALKGGVQEFKTKLDADEYGGAPLLGISKVVIKAHGSSNAKAIKNAIRQAKTCCENGMLEAIEQNMQTETEAVE